MHYCRTCGSLLDPEDVRVRTTGHCPSCGTPFAPEQAMLPGNGNTFSNADTVPVTATLPMEAGVGSAKSPTLARQLRRRRTLRALGALLLLFLLLLACAYSPLLTSLLPPTTRGTATETGISSTTAGGTTQVPVAQASLAPPASPVVTASTSPGSTAAGGTSTVSADGRPTATPGGHPLPPTATPPPQPALTVVPITININLCVASIAQFTVRNSGTGVMTWSTTTASTVVVVLPASGTLMQGQQATVSVTSISTTTQVTVHAPQAKNAPQVVSITCD